jgi:histidine ammonia-lyase
MWQVLSNCERAVAIELLAASQAVEFHAPLEPGAGGRAARAAVRELSPRLKDDRSLAPDIEAVARAIADGSIVAAVEAAVGELE